MKFELEKIVLDLKVNWKLSRNESLTKTNFIFKIIEDDMVYMGEIAPNIRYHETSEKILRDFDHFQSSYSPSIPLEKILYESNFSHSFQFAVESAFTHRNSQMNLRSIKDFLHLPEINEVETSFSVPIMDESLLGNYLKQLSRFKFIKIKTNQDNAIRFVKTIASKTNAILRVDGNEAWEDFDLYKKFEEQVKHLNIQFVEQPFKAKMVDEYIALKKNSLFEIMADESIEQEVDFDLIEQQFHSINVKLMKAGGYQKAIALLKEAKKRKMKTMLGCMIETSLGISCALQLAGLADYYDLDGSLLIKKDPFNFIQESNGSLSLK